MTSSSASGSTWRTLYGSIASGIVGPHPDVRQRDRERLGLVRGEAAEEVPHDVTERGRDGQSQDRAQQPRQRPADDDREDDRRRVKLDGIALDLRHEDGVLDLLDEEVQEQGGDDRHRTDGRREQHRRYRRQDRTDDRDELEHAGDDRQEHGVPSEDRVDEVAQGDQSDERRDADCEAEQDLAADPLPEVTLDGLDDRPGVEPPRLRQRPVEGRDQGRLVVEDVGDPDGQDEVGEHRAQEAARTRDQREQEGQVRSATATGATLADPGDEAVDPLANRDRDLEVGVEVAESLELEVEVVGELREVVDEADDFVDERREGDRQEREEQDDADDVDEEDRERSSETAADEPADRRIEQVDEQQAEDER